MIEAEAKEWIADRFGHHAIPVIETFRDMLIDEQSRQNLVSSSTIDDFWTRHILDSAQLLEHAPQVWDLWVDIGTGGGFPGLIIAILTKRHVTLIEPRRLRSAFLQKCADLLQLPKVRVIQSHAETIQIPQAASVVTARAVAKLPVLLSVCRHFCDGSTTYIFPKGASARSEVASVAGSWQGTFHVKQSMVDPMSGIIVATGVAPR